MILSVAVAAAVASTGCYAVGAVLQQRLAVQLPLRRFGRLVRHRGWWVAIGLALGGGLLHVLALRYGPLSLVQPLGALTLVLALPVGAVLARHRVSARHWRGAALTVVGLAILLMLTAPASHVRSLAADQVLTVLAVAGGIAVALVVAGLAVGQAVGRSLLFAGAAGLAFGVGSALTQTVAVAVTTVGVAGLMQPAAPATIGFAVFGFLLTQASYRGGGLGAPLATITLVNPAAAALIGLLLLGERYSGGEAGVALALVAALVAASGVMLLARPAAGYGTGRRPPSRRPAAG